ncbi:PucR C-terminal helix-turn-helix domain-containing protein [Acetitomaculum ruminis DSM 5522]|uniref:PucR C-terminal helix-turn-helix domain-containing protein n=1 Tax=Acetitomaculum ruminis DSM 5522 TaxID=1120918 RepID=A0A1I0XQP6_9FIRM|nr:helix-turn-helix domain-containing protein [Acetitomaculum ruminis]SFB02263.1 PucR C-terminal helix-turn-helix domain-containing protein [Acetitomaculum ruminis DSM 5522]
MKLSMWILKNWLSKYDIIANVTNGDMLIEGARLFSIESQMSYYPYLIYVGSADGFIGSMGNQVICVCGPDWIRIKDTDKEQIFNDILQAFDYYNKWEEIITSYNRQDITAQILLNFSQGIFLNPVFVIDSYSNLVAMSEQYDEGQVNDEWDYLKKNGIMSLDTLGKIKKIPHLIDIFDNSEKPVIYYNEVFKCKTLTSTISFNNEKKGVLVILEKDSFLQEHTIQLTQIFLSAISKLMIMQLDIPEFNPGVNMFNRILKGIEVADAKKTQLLKPIGWELHSNFIIYKIKNRSHDLVSTRALANRIPSIMNSGISFEYDQDIFYIVNCSLCNVSKLEEDLSALLMKSDFICGASFQFSNLDDVSVYYKQAELALNLGKQEAGTISHCIDYIWDHVSVTYAPTFFDLHLCHPAVKKLLDYDNEHGTKFLETLHYYLRNERRLTQTAKMMYLHRNTLFYRIERITEIMDTDMEDPDEREHILLSLMILRLAENTQEKVQSQKETENTEEENNA